MGSRRGSDAWGVDLGSSWLMFLFGACLGGLGTCAWIVWGGSFRVLESWSSSYDDLAHYRRVRNFVLDNYVEEPDPDELVRVALTGMLESLDEYSRYYHTADEIEGYRRETRGSFAGIGIVFSFAIGAENQVHVLFPFEGSPAARAGVRVGDLITSVDGESIVGLPQGQLSTVFIGEEGSTVTLGLVGLDGEERLAKITRETRTDFSVRHAHLIDDEHKIGYLAVTSFTLKTTSEFEDAMTTLGELGVEGLVMDLRGNPGGVAKAAIELAEHFISDGVILEVRGRAEPVIYRKTPSDDVELEALPLVVLIDGNSASSSEVLAAALQDHRVAVLVGTPTFGKARIQKVVHFVDANATVKITSSYYTTPSGQNLDRSPERPWGLQPDLVVEVDRETERLIHRHINRYEPPAEAFEAIHAWEDSSGKEILPPSPEDPQLEAALALLRGEHPEGG